MNTKPDFISKICPSCNKKFDCYENNVSLCHCSKIKLNESTLAQLKKKYKDCLCSICLKNFTQQNITNFVDNKI